MKLSVTILFSIISLSAFCQRKQKVEKVSDGWLFGITSQQYGSNDTTITTRWGLEAGLNQEFYKHLPEGDYSLPNFYRSTTASISLEEKPIISLKHGFWGYHFVALGIHASAQTDFTYYNIAIHPEFGIYFYYGKITCSFAFPVGNSRFERYKNPFVTINLQVITNNFKKSRRS